VTACAIAVCAFTALAAPSAGAFQFLSKWGGPGSGPGQLDQPFDMAVNPATGHQYIADTGNNRIVEFDTNGVFVRAWGGLGSGDAQFNSPGGVGLDVAGNVWVADDGNNRIKKFDPNGNLIGVFGSSGTGPGLLSGPDDVAVDATGNFYEVEQGNGRVQKFNSTGGFVQQWAASNPTGVAVFGTTVYVVNYNADTGQIFDTDGNPLGAFGGSGTGGGQFSQPWHLGIDGSGRLYVADRSNNRVQVLDAAGNFIQTFGWGVSSGAAAFEVCTANCLAGIFGTGDGQFGAPAGAGVDCRGNVYVVEQNYRVQKFGEPGTRNPPCPSNEFSFGKVKKNKRKGTASLTVVVPGPGQLVLTGKGLKRSQAGAARERASAAASSVKLLIKAKGKKGRKLGRTGRVKVRPKVTYTPTNGDPNAKSRRLKLVKRR
jgi:DNA-binding beta-propeller fold protein YncE